jgi:hypothetical protein
MPFNRDRAGTVYIDTGNPDTVNENWQLTLQNVGYAQGELGTDYSWRNKRYQIVQLDPAAATPTSANTLAYWADRINYIVTGNAAAAIGGTTGAINQVAGRFGTAVTPGYRCHIQQRGPAALPSLGGTFLAGQSVTGTNTGGVAAVPFSTAPTAPVVGQAQGPAAAGVVQVYMDIQPIE